MVDELGDPGIVAYLEDVILHTCEPDAHIDLLDQYLEVHFQSRIRLKAKVDKGGMAKFKQQIGLPTAQISSMKKMIMNPLPLSLN